MVYSVLLVRLGRERFVIIDPTANVSVSNTSTYMDILLSRRTKHKHKTLLGHQLGFGLAPVCP
jgi:hypothetical protein